MKIASIKRSYLAAVAMAGLIALWFASGLFSGGDNGKDPVAAGQGGSPAKTEQSGGDVKRLRVKVATFTARERRPLITVRGRTEVLRRIEVRAQMSGTVVDVPFSEGDRVREGDLLCRVDIGTLPARLAKAIAGLAQARLDFAAADRLEKQRFTSKTKRAAELAKLQAAQADVAQMEREIAYTRITAPVGSTIEKRPAERGSFVAVGGLCATLIIRDPMLVIGQLAERDVTRVNKGMAGSARLVSGETVTGKIRFVSAVSDHATRTFRVELEVANPNRSLRDGVTSEISIPLPPENAHQLPPSLLVLDDKGNLGVKAVSPEARVSFTAVKVLSFGRNEVWVSGLPNTVTLITLGQQYVTAGQIVDPVPASAKSASK